MIIIRWKLIAVTAAVILGGTGTASARSDRADEQLEEHFGDGRHSGRGRGKGNAHGPDIEDGDDTEGYMLTISVVDAETGEPIEGAIVQGLGDRDAYGGDKLFAVTTGPDGTGNHRRATRRISYGRRRGRLRTAVGLLYYHRLRHVAVVRARTRVI